MFGTDHTARMQIAELVTKLEQYDKRLVAVEHRVTKLEHLLYAPDEQDEMSQNRMARMAADIIKLQSDTDDLETRLSELENLDIEEKIDGVTNALEEAGNALRGL